MKGSHWSIWIWNYEAPIKFLWDNHNSPMKSLSRCDAQSSQIYCRVNWIFSAIKRQTPPMTASSVSRMFNFFCAYCAGRIAAMYDYAYDYIMWCNYCAMQQFCDWLIKFQFVFWLTWAWWEISMNHDFIDVVSLCFLFWGKPESSRVAGRIFFFFFFSSFTAHCWIFSERREKWNKDRLYFSIYIYLK